MMRRKSPPSENNILYLIENHCQTNNISKGRRGKALILFSGMRQNCTMCTCPYDITKIFYIICSLVIAVI